MQGKHEIIKTDTVTICCLYIVTQKKGTLYPTEKLNDDNSDKKVEMNTQILQTNAHNVINMKPWYQFVNIFDCACPSLVCTYMGTYTYMHVIPYACVYR